MFTSSRQDLRRSGCGHPLLRKILNRVVIICNLEGIYHEDLLFAQNVVYSIHNAK